MELCNLTFWVDLKQCNKASLNVCPPINTYVCPSVHKKVFPISTKFGYVGRGMPHDTILFGQGHKGLKIAEKVDLKLCLLRQYTFNQKINGEL